MSKPIVYTIRLEQERANRGLSRQALADSVGLPELVDYRFDLETLRPFSRRSEILRRIARVFGMPESEAHRLLDKVYGNR